MTFYKIFGKTVILTVLLTFFQLKAQDTVAFKVEMPDPSKQLFQVQMDFNSEKAGHTDVKIPVWMPGYYQVLEYPEKISAFTATTAKGEKLKWEKAGKTSWRIYHDKPARLRLTYKALANRKFVATNFMDDKHAYIAPGGVFMYPSGGINSPVKIELQPYPEWPDIATGLESNDKQEHLFYAENYDKLYDSPILIGNLKEIMNFEVQDVPHRFIAYEPGDFDTKVFAEDLKMIIEEAVKVIGEIPFEEYQFIGIGPGAGGIEHLNNTIVSFSGNPSWNDRKNRIGVLSFLAHEYFHHYNAKRIRPIELGPFDYDHGSRTNMLWVAEGITSYYDDLLLLRAGITTTDDFLGSMQGFIQNVETSPGRLFQSVSEASYDTWSDGPFGRKGDEVNKTVSYYEKGPILGWLLDLRIRHETKNERSLDDVMRKLYYDIYKEQNRGYTEEEFQKICEDVAGTGLSDFFEYVYSVKPIDYNKYLNYAGLRIDNDPKTVDAAYSGIHLKLENEKCLIEKVDWNSPGWYEGIRRGNEVLTINSEKATPQKLEKIMENLNPNDILKLKIQKKDSVELIPVLLTQQKETTFQIEKLENPTSLQKQIRKELLLEKL